MRKRILIVIVACAAAASGGDWPQWRGPDRTGHVHENLKALPAEPKVNWKIATTEGLSSPVVAGGKVFHFEAEEGKEVLRALKVENGERIWSAVIDETFKDNQGPPGPRCTPVVDGDRVYVVSCRGELQCRAVGTGEKIWNVNYLKDFGAIFVGEKGNVPGAARHGNNGSPLIHGDHLFAGAGGTNGSVVCLNKKTGAVIWKSLEEQAAYAPPVILKLAGMEQLVCFMADSVLALKPDDGKLLWRFPVKTAYARHVTTPVSFEDIVVVSSHQVGTIGLKVSSDKVEQAWISKEAAMNFSSPIAVGRHLFGLGPKSDVICVDIPTGKLLWSKPGYFTTSADKSEAAFLVFEKNILMLTDGGRLILFEANPNEMKELSVTQVCGSNWCNPAYSNGNLYVRDGIRTTGNLISLRLK